MARKVAYNAGSTLVEGFYDDAVHTSIPSPNITVSDGEYDNALAQQAAGKVLKVISSAMDYSDPTVVLADYKAQQQKVVDAQAMREFNKHHDFSNAGFPAYQLKLSEWWFAKDDGTPTGGEYPMLQAQATADGVSLATAIADFGTAHATLTGALDNIEIVRLEARADVLAAASVAAVDAVMAAIAWPA